MKKILGISLLILSGLMQAHAQPGYQRTPKGAAYRIFARNTGPKIKPDDIVTFQVIQKTDRDSVLFSSYASGRPVQIKVQPSQNVADLMEVFPLLAVSDSAIVKIPADSVFKGAPAMQRPPFLPAGSHINYLIKVVKVQSLSEAMSEANAALEKLKQAEAAEANRYVTANKLMPKSTPSGLRYIITRASAKRKPLRGDTLLVNYTGRLTSGKVFDSSIAAEAQAGGLNQPGRNYEPIQVIVGQGQVIPGWDEGLLLLNEGSKAIFIIPSNLGYGAQGAGEIKPYSTLIFNVELVKVKPAKPVANSGTKRPVPHTASKRNVRKS